MAVAPKNLIIPGKNSHGAHTGYSTDMRVIETWANNLSTGGSGFYASLTGSGETNPTGSLVQSGGFVVNDSTVSGIQLLENGGGIIIEDTAAGGVFIEDGGGGILIREQGGGGMQILEQGGGGITIHESGAGDLLIGVSGGGNMDITAGNQTLNVAGANDTLSFFENGGDPIQIVTGSRGGNAALASLLTALANYGLIQDSTTP